MSIVRIDKDYWVSEEQIDGEPDWTIWRDRGEGWRVKGRTSAHNRLFPTMAQAKKYVREASSSKRVTWRWEASR